MIFSFFSHTRKTKEIIFLIVFQEEPSILLQNLPLAGSAVADLYLHPCFITYKPKELLSMINSKFLCSTFQYDYDLFK